jgi:Ca2+-binding RTX toxin-like protein
MSSVSPTVLIKGAGGNDKASVWIEGWGTSTPYDDTAIVDLWYAASGRTVHVHKTFGLWLQVYGGIKIQLVTAVQFQGYQGNDRFDNWSGLRSDLFGGDGTDTLVGGWGIDYLYGEGNNDTLIGGAGDDYLSGHSGDDTMYGDAGVDRLDGGANKDYLAGGGETDYLYGRDGNDTLDGWYGNDYLYGGTGDDQLFGWDGNDSLYGENGYDILFGENGDDFLDGGKDFTHDSLIGGADADDFKVDWYSGGPGFNWNWDDPTDFNDGERDELIW